VVVGPPGSGKSSYCVAMKELLLSLNRKPVLISLDPANDIEDPSVDISLQKLIQVSEVMETQNLGPNGALVFCMEMLEKNLNWLLNQMAAFPEAYFIFDLPGQAELYTHHTMVRDLLDRLDKEGLQLCSVFLCETHLANDPGKYISATMLALSSMLQLSTPHVNLLSKIDLMDKYDSYQMPLNFYTDVLDLDYLIDHMEDSPWNRKYRKLHTALAELVTSYSLVSFLPVTVNKRESLLSVLKEIDKANGYIFGSDEERNIQRLLSCAVGANYDGAEDFSIDCEEDEDREDHLMRAYATQNPNVR